MILLHASGTQTATVTTEHSLGTATVEGRFKFEVDMNAMAAGDVLELRINKIILTGGTKRLAYFGAFYGAQPSFALVAISDEVWNELADANSLEFTLKQTFGTGRAYPWKVLRDRTLSETTDGRTLDVSATGEAGVDWNNVGTPGATVNLSATTTNVVNTASSVTALATGAVGTGDIASAALNEIADATLDRVMSAGTDSGADNTTSRTVRQALRALRNKVAIAAGTATIYKEDDVAASWTSAITTTAGNPISTSDPT